MILLRLFLVFLKVGAFTFGGGYAMLSLIEESVMEYGWMTQEEFLNFIGVETVIPGPIAVNMATYIGYTQGGFLGALAATAGVVLPSFIIILIVAAVLKNLMKYKPINAFITGMRPAVGGLILSVGLTLGLTAFFGFESFNSSAFTYDVRTVVIFAAILLLELLFFKLMKKKPSSILLVAVSALLGILFFGA